MKTLLSAITLAVLSFNVSAGMVVIGNNAGVESLSKSDVKKLFMGKKSKLANGTKAQIIELVDGMRRTGELSLKLGSLSRECKTSFM